ncbi:MAG: histidine kinase, partial [Propionibacteriaceae bacterium]|nr:histidine kinase [Propionibacteriaceae bacterium]
NALRRLERDLHDGPQQTLIRLGMDLSACERRLSKGDMASAISLLQGARHLTETVIAELRALSRSIAPPVLAERGLKAALLEASAHCPMPVRLQYDLSQEPPQATAIAAYYVTCEALANAVKHSSASHVAVSVTPDGDNHLVVKISDDGIGGAVSVPGHGLAGLADRVAALDGHLTVTGAPGTTLTAILPMRQDLR